MEKQISHKPKEKETSKCCEEMVEVYTSEGALNMEKLGTYPKEKLLKAIKSLT